MSQLTSLLLAAVQAAVQVPSEAPPQATLSLGDFDGDGLADVLALSGGTPRLFENLGQGEFADASLRAGLPELAGVRQAAWQDADGDGDLDLLLVAPAHGLHLLRNDQGRFADVTAQAGLGELRDVARASFLGLDGDALPDLWLEGPEGDRLLRQERAGTFVAVALELSGEAPSPFGAPAATDSTVEADVPDARAAREREPAAAGARVRAAAGAADIDGQRERPDARESALGGVVVSGVTSGPTLPGLGCSPRLLDTSTGSCLTASSLPTLGTLYPLGPELNIDSAGRVGMGTTTPSHRLTVQTLGSDDALRLIGEGVLGSQARLNFGDGDYAYLYEDVDDSLEIHSSGRTALTGGNVGIGTKAPIWPLHVVSPGQAVGRFDSQNATNGSAIELRNNSVSPAKLGELNFVGSAPSILGQIAYRASNDMTFSTNGPERMRIDALGRVGVGTSVPLWPLHVVSSGQAVGRFDSGNATFGSVIELRNNTPSPGTIGAINFVNSAGAFNGQIEYTGTDSMRFRVGGAERMRIVSTGRLGIGTSFPTAPVDVRGSAPNNSPVMRVAETDGGGGTAAIEATSPGMDAAAIRGINTAPLAGTGGSETIGVHGIAFGDSVGGYLGAAGVLGESDGELGHGVWGRATGSFAYGVRGSTTSGGYGVICDGKFVASGSKAFAQPHPKDPSKEIHFLCLEGNESGTYFRGTSRLTGGRTVIDVPEEFRLVSESGGLTVQVTPAGKAFLWCESKSLDRIVIRGTEDVEFDYFVNGVRRGYADPELLQENRLFVPQERGVPFGGQFPEAVRRILVENGTLNADFTPNESTAARMGWILRDATPEEKATPSSNP